MGNYAGWFFLHHDHNRVIDQITGNFPLEADFGQRWGDLIARRTSRAESVSARYFMIIAPNKECVYASYLPDGISVSERRPVFEMINHSESKVIIYPLEQLKQRAMQREVYPKGDSHWNIHGALEAYYEFAERAAFRAVERSEMSFSMQTSGDLCSKVGETTEYEIGSVVNRKHRMVYHNNVANLGNMICYENEDKSLPKCVLFRDSFATILLDVLAQSFSKLIAVWQPNIDYSIVESEQPDIILSVMAERFITTIPDDENGPSNKEHVHRKVTAGI